MTLTLTNIQPANAGNYWIIATNSYGSATSSVVALVITNSIGTTNVVNSPDEASLRAAIKIGGWVSIEFNGTVTITNTISITNHIILVNNTPLCQRAFSISAPTPSAT